MEAETYNYKKGDRIITMGMDEGGRSESEYPGTIRFIDHKAGKALIQYDDYIPGLYINEDFKSFFPEN